MGTGRLTTTLAANLTRLLIVGNAQTTPGLAGKEEIFFGVRERAFVKASA